MVPSWIGDIQEIARESERESARERESESARERERERVRVRERERERKIIQESILAAYFSPALTLG